MNNRKQEWRIAIAVGWLAVAGLSVVLAIVVRRNELAHWHLLTIGAMCLAVYSTILQRLFRDQVKASLELAERANNTAKGALEVAAQYEKQVAELVAKLTANDR